jgi:hypothetical protein
MRSIVRPRIAPRITPTFGVAVAALVVAMTGTSYAAVAINGSSIKAHTIKGSKLVNNTLGGTQINESKLGIVPQSSFAVRAQDATSADSAKTALKAANADHATSADHATEADHADSADKATKATTATTATTAGTADDSKKLGGSLPSEFVRSARTVRSATIATIPADSTVEQSVFCNADEIAVGGGGGWFILGSDTPVASATLSVAIPDTDTTTGRSGFRMEGKNTSPVPRDAKVFAICLKVG